MKQIVRRQVIPTAVLRLNKPSLLARRTASTFTSDVIPTSLTPNSFTTGTAALPHEGDGAKRDTGFIYFDTVFPIRMGVWDVRYLAAQVEKKGLLDQLRSLVPADSAYDTRIEDVWPREKDGGAFVKFSYTLPTQPFVESTETAEELKAKKEKALAVLEKEARDAIVAQGAKLWYFAWNERGAFVVRGKPWMEDMNRFPNNSIRIEFEGPEIPQEELYELFRPYGKINNIYPQPASNKDVPRYATITYRGMRSAAAARNCLHGAVVTCSTPSATPSPPTQLRILFSERAKAHYIRDWITNHPRISLPIFVALLGGLSWAVFDPIREFFIKNKVKGTWNASKWTFVTWLRSETLGRLGLVKTATKSGTTGIEREREDAKEELSTWLRDVPDTFIVCTGPRGSGKTALVKDVTSDHANVLTIDCAQICRNAKSETKLVSELASALGYWPQFVLAASINNMIDLASVGLIGQKAGFSATLDAQLKQILEVASTALKSLAADRNARLAKEAKRSQSKREHVEEHEKIVDQLGGPAGIRDGRIDTVSGSGAMSELGAGIERPDKDSVVIVGPQSSSLVKNVVAVDPATSGCPSEPLGGLPIIVIQNFAMKGDAKQDILWDVLSEWAAVLVENQVAHVVFTSESVLVTKHLAKALPSKPFNSIALNDASPDSAIQYVQSKLSEFDTDSSLSDTTRTHVAKLGGRLTDLELLVQKIRAGLRPDEAVNDIIGRNATEIRKNFFGDDAEEAKGLKWTREQAWSLVKGLSNHGELKYADVLVNPPFKSNENALRALETAEMISIQHREGRPSVIKAGKPVYQSAFKQLLSDPVFAASVDYEINAKAITSATEDLNSASKALMELSQLFAGGKWTFGGGAVPKEIEVRVTGLLASMGAAETKLQKLGKQKEELLVTLAESS